MKWDQVNLKELEPIQFIKSMEGYLDRYHMLQWKHGGGEYQDLPPHSRFYQRFAEEVVRRYGTKGLTAYGEEGQMIHQFRMYIDEQNIRYIRKRFKRAEMTDEDALRVYVETPGEYGGLGGRMLLKEPARLHNKYPKEYSYWKYQKGRGNKKRLTPDFHSEFILDPSGSFVSQWNILERDRNGNVISNVHYYRRKYEKRRGMLAMNPQYTWEEVQRQIMDTESFNYAFSNNVLHKRLDMQPPKLLDPDLRRQIGKDWKSPGKWEYDYASDKGDGYSRSNS